METKKSISQSSRFIRRIDRDGRMKGRWEEEGEVMGEKMDGYTSWRGKKFKERQRDKDSKEEGWKKQHKENENARTENGNEDDDEVKRRNITLLGALREKEIGRRR